MNGVLVEPRGKRGSWGYRLDFRDPMTKQRRQPQFGGFRTKKDAEAALIRARAQGSKSVADSRLTLADYLTQWVRNYVALNDLAPNTRRGYEKTITVHIIPGEFGSIRLRDLEPTHIDAYLARKLDGTISEKARRKDRHLSRTTIQHIYSLLHTALQDAVQKGILPSNPCDRVKRPGRAHHEMRILDQEQTQLFLAAVRRYYAEKTPKGTPKRQNLYPLFLAAVLTGARQGELLGLTWKAVDLTLGTMAIQQTFYRVGKEQVFKQPKTENSSRAINLPPIMVEELRQVRRDQNEYRRRFGPQYEDHDLVFCQENGKPLHGRNLTRRDLKRILKRAKLPEIRFHDLRHGRATLGLKNGEHPKLVSEILGHSSVAFTMQTYSHILPGMQAEAARKLEESLLGSAHILRTNTEKDAGTAGETGLAVH